METKSAVDLLPDREANTLSKRIKDHPEIKLISRDRYSNYALGSRRGAPDAIQVADRFHLIMNLGEVVKRMIHNRNIKIKEVFNLYNNQALPETPFLTNDFHVTNKSEEVITSINPKRQLKFEKVKEFNQQGYTIIAIARALAMNRRTVKSYLKLDKLYKRQSQKTTNF
jgi:transposase